MTRKKILFTGFISLSAISITQAALTFAQASFTAQAQMDLSPAEQAMFQDALDFWDNLIIDHRDGASRVYNLTVDTFSTARDPSTGVITLGSAGPTSGTFTGQVVDAHTSDNRFFVATAGLARVNTHPDAGALDSAVLRHEIGHALGIGTLWEENENYNDGNPGNDTQFTGDRTAPGGIPGQYIGPNGLAAYRAEFDAGAAYIPVELDGGTGTANGHWNEAADNPRFENVLGPDSDPGDGSPAPMDVNGNSFDDELMTGLKSGSTFLSNTTVFSLRDLGFNVIPEPSGVLLIVCALPLLTRRRR